MHALLVEPLFEHMLNQTHVSCGIFRPTSANRWWMSACCMWLALNQFWHEILDLLHRIIDHVYLQVNCIIDHSNNLVCDWMQNYTIPQKNEHNELGNIAYHLSK